MKLADRYEIVRRVGEGGGGGVFLVRDRLADGAEMVLKRLQSHAHAGVAQWLLNEFQVLAQLELSTVARVFDFGLAEADAEDPGGAFMTREFVDGVPLDQALGAPETLDPDKLLGWFRSAAQTVGALHRVGVVHGDLKPANLIVPRESDRVILIDFGLAHGALAAAARIRGGTLAFMPPERRDQLMAGESLVPDPRADLYALSVSLLCALGVNTPDAPTPSWIKKKGPFARWVEMGRRGAAMEPTGRFATADDFLVALDGGGSTRGAASPARVVLRPEGRESELGTMLDAVARRLVRAEWGTAVLALVGEEGSGRSTLLRELAWRAQLRGVQVLAVQGEPGDAPSRRLHVGAHVLASEPLDSDQPDALVSAFRKAASKAPVLILADDLDRADPAVAAQLRSIAYGCEANEPLLVIATCTDEKALGALAPTTVVTLGALDEASVAALCKQILGPVEPDIVAAVRARTGGLPLAVHEVLSVLGQRGAVTAADVQSLEDQPRGRELARRRVSALSPALRTTVAALAALGRPSDPDTLLAVLPTAQPDAARSAGMISLRSDGKLALSQVAFGDAALETVPHKHTLLRRAADVLERANVSATERALAWVRAGDAQAAQRDAKEAIADLRAAGLPRAGGELLASIRALDPSVDTEALRVEEAELFADAGATVAALSAIEKVTESGDPVLAQRARLLSGKLFEKKGELGAARAMLSRALDHAMDGDGAADCLRELALVDFRGGLYAESAARCEQALVRAQSPRIRATVLSRFGLAMSYLGNQARAVELCLEALSLFAELNEPREEARVLAYLAIARGRTGEFAEARSLAERTLERARAAGDVAAMSSARLNLGTILDRLGDLAGALEHYGAATKLAQRAGDTHGPLMARLNIAGDLIRIGSYERAGTEVEAALVAARTLGVPELVASAKGMLGSVRARRGDVDAALGLLAEAAEAFAAMGHSEGMAEAEFDAAEVLLDRGASGDVIRAGEKIARAKTLATDSDAFSARATLLEARIALSNGDARGAQKLLGEAVATAERTGQWEVLSLALSVRSNAHRQVGAEIHARRDRDRALEVLEATASTLPPDLRSAFWSVPARAALRNASTDPSWHEAPAPASASIPLASTITAHDQRMVLLLELSRRVGEEQTLERVLDQAVRSAVELTNAERGAVLLVGDGGALAIHAHSGRDPSDSPDAQFSRSIAETVLIDGEAIATHDARSDVRFADYRSVHELAITAVAAVPIRARGKTLGVMYVENRRRRTVWSPSDVALMKAFAEQAGIAVDHARLVTELSARSRELEGAKREIEALLETRTQELESTRTSLARAQEALQRRYTPEGLVASTEAMRKVFEIIDRVRDTGVSVVIEGESGTGKELIARAVHFGSARKKGPFVVVHCGAIPETLVESELFGHVKGAFTGADRNRKGLIASAHGGTLLLDEIADMPSKMQVELLRVLQDKRVRPVGAEQDEAVDVRVMAASNRPLAELVEAGRFREDLYYRLAVVTIKIPPLRARPDDIPALASHFLESFVEENGAARKRLSREALDRLAIARWPGNVRQLRHVLESAAVLTDGDLIDVEHLALDEASRSIPPPGADEGDASPASQALRRATERQRILAALEQENWNKIRVAKLLGMPRRTLYRRLREYGILDE